MSSAPTRHMRRRPWSRWGGCALVVLLLSGCQWMKRQDFGQPLQASASKELLIARVNENVRRLQGGWRSDNVRIRFPNMVVGVSASIYVQPERNFRLRATSMRGDEADLGSNDERFWFWIRDAAPQSELITVKHEDLAEAQPRLRIPFHMDWLMQVLCVEPLDPALFEVQQATDGTWILEAHTLAPNGQEVRRRVRVDGKYGLVLGHSLYDDVSNMLIARAVLTDHRPHPSGAILPSQIALEWPQQGLAMTLQIGAVQVNDLAQKGSQIWQLPTGHPVIDLSQRLGRRPRPGVQLAGGTPQPARYARREEPPWAETRRTPAAAPPSEPPWSDPHEPPWSADPPPDSPDWQPPLVRRAAL